MHFNDIDARPTHGPEHPAGDVMAITRKLTSGCRIDPDGLALTVCAEHAPAAWQYEYRVRRLLDAELDEVIRELAKVIGDNKPRVS